MEMSGWAVDVASVLLLLRFLSALFLGDALNRRASFLLEMISGLVSRKWSLCIELFQIELVQTHSQKRPTLCTN